MPHFPFAYHGGKQPDMPEETWVMIELAKVCAIIGDGCIEVAEIYVAFM